jgi:hypothetical protein
MMTQEIKKKYGQAGKGGQGQPGANFGRGSSVPNPNAPGNNIDQQANINLSKIEKKEKSQQNKCC